MPAQAACRITRGSGFDDAPAAVYVRHLVDYDLTCLPFRLRCRRTLRRRAYGRSRPQTFPVPYAGFSTYSADGIAIVYVAPIGAFLGHFAQDFTQLGYSCRTERYQFRLGRWHCT